MRVYDEKFSSSSALHAECLGKHSMSGLFQEVAKKILNFDGAHDRDTKPHRYYAVYRRGESSQNVFGYVRVLKREEDFMRMYARTQNGRAPCIDLEDAGDTFATTGYFSMRVQNREEAERALKLMKQACSERS